MAPFDSLNRSGLAMLADDALPETDALQAYWRDPAAYIAVERRERARCHAAIDAGMARINARQAARWEAEARA